MPFTLENIVPWGRSYDEYLAMFALDSSDLAKCILGCGDGPASFNSTLHRNGGTVVSVDPIYVFSPAQIDRRIKETTELVLAETIKNRDEFVWKTITSPDALKKLRLAAMNEFLADFAPGKKQGRYLPGCLPDLPFADKRFNIVLCSHLLFLYSKQLSYEFHLAAIRDLCRVAEQVRIFPLLELGAKKSRHLEPAITQLQQEGYQLQIVRVDYEFQKGGNEMLLVSTPG